MRPIDADAMRQDWLENGENEYVYDTNAFLDSIDSQPTLDVEPVKHGRLEKGGKGMIYKSNDKKKLSNWTKTMIALCTLLLLLLNPFTRQIIFFILPLGSGIDDLIFFIVLFITISVFLLKASRLDKVKDWLIRWFSK